MTKKQIINEQIRIEEYLGKYYPEMPAVSIILSRGKLIVTYSLN